MASYVVIYPNMVGISHGHIYGLEWTVVADGLSISERNDAYLLKEEKKGKLMTGIFVSISW